ncbi:MAG: SOS response-associated peptidase [Bacteroidota bacterium]
MCGRFGIIHSVEEIEEHFKASFIESSIFSINYNASPGVLLPLIFNTNNAKIDFCNWGMPIFRNSPSKIAINTRIESINEKPFFYQLLKSKRCIIPASGYFEWKKESSIKQPYYIFNKKKSLLAFAGIYSSFKINNKYHNCFSIITTVACEKIKSIHHRMPLIIEKQNFKTWLDEKNNNTSKMLINNNISEDIDFHSVSQKVNSIKNNSAELITKTTIFKGLFD